MNEAQRLKGITVAHLNKLLYNFKSSLYGDCIKKAEAEAAIGKNTCLIEVYNLAKSWDYPIEFFHKIESVISEALIELKKEGIQASMDKSESPVATYYYIKLNW